MVHIRSSILCLCVLCTLVLSASADEKHRSTDEIAAMIESAEPGATITVPPGVYEGILKIEKPISLEGNGQVTIDGMGLGSVIEIVVGDVAIRGMTIRNPSDVVGNEAAGIRVSAGPVYIENNLLEDMYFGIDLRPAADSVVRNNTIYGKDMELGRRGDGIRLWWSHNCTIEGNTVDGLRDMVFWYSENLNITRNHVKNSRYGLHFMYSHHTTLTENDLAGNSVGIYLMYSNDIHLIRNTMTNNRGTSGYGIGLKDCDNITVEDNALLANRVGVFLDNSPSSVDSFGLIIGNKIAFNEIGLLATPITHDNVISGNAFIENEEQAAAHGRGQLSSNKFVQDGIGNFWSNYAGFDGDGDGIGDFPFAPRSLFRTLLAREPNLGIFLHSPAQQAIELTARAFPDLSPEPMFVDDAPLTHVPELDLLINPRSGSRIPMIVFAAGLLLISGLGAYLVAHQPGLPLRSDFDSEIKVVA